MPSPTTSPSTTASTHWDAHLWGILAVLCGALFLDGLDVSMVGVALPSIQQELGLSTEQLSWVVSGYVLGFGGFLLLGGRAADLLGRRRMFLLAGLVFALASLLGGVAQDGTLLVLTRFVKGVAAAFTVPAGLSLITTSFAEGPARDRALSIYAAVGASGFSLGLVVGGVLTTLGWRWTFLVPAPVALAIVVAGWRLIRPDLRAPISLRQFDVGGALSVTLGMLVLVRTVVRAPEVGWGAGETLAGFAIAAALLVAFVAIERRVAHPLVRLGIFRSGSLVRANVAAFLLFGSYVAFQFVTTLYLQSMLGWSALEMALALLPGGLVVVFSAGQVGKLVGRIGTGWLLVISFTAFAAGYALFLRIGADPSYVGLVLPTMLLIGVGFATGFPAFNIQATAGIADHEQGLASGLVTSSTQLGGAVVLAVGSALVTSSTGVGGGAEALLDGYRTVIALVTGLTLLALAISLAGVATRRAPVAALEGAEA